MIAISMKQIAQFCLKQMEEQKITKVELSNKAGLARSTVYDILDENSPEKGYNIKNLMKILDVLGYRLEIQRKKMNIYEKDDFLT